MTFGRVHVVGAGMAGLSAATLLAEVGHPVSLYESAPYGGGRCRSYFDRALDCRVDNGNHLSLSGNRDVQTYLARIGAADRLIGPDEPFFPFMDLTTDERWTLRPNMGRVPWWIFSRARRVPGTGARDYLALNALRSVRDARTVAALLPRSTLTRRLLEPLAIAALNTPPDEAIARLLSAVIHESLARGGAACIPLLPRQGLSESFVDPAMAWLVARDASVAFNQRVTALQSENGRVTALVTADGTIPVAAHEAVVLAVPPWIAADLLPGLNPPDVFQAIVNVHFRASPARDTAPFIGLIGGVAEWVFVKPGHVSVTISAANRLTDDSADAVAAATWPDVRRALSLPESMPPYRVVKERRATFAATEAQERKRPPARTALKNLVLAGDWTATGLPATIEGAIRSGRTAAEILLRTA